MVCYSRVRCLVYDGRVRKYSTWHHKREDSEKRTPQGMLALSLTCTLENRRLGWDRQVTWFWKIRNICNISVRGNLTKHWLAAASYWQLKLVELVKNISEVCQLMRPRNFWKIILASDQLNAQIILASDQLNAQIILASDQLNAQIILASDQLNAQIIFF